MVHLGNFKQQNPNADDDGDCTSQNITSIQIADMPHF
jgi:hypothetical protein